MTLVFLQHLPHPLAAFAMAALSLQTPMNLKHRLTCPLGKIAVAPHFLLRKAHLVVPVDLRKALVNTPFFPQRPTYLPLGTLIVPSTFPLVVLVLAHPSPRLPWSLALSPFSPGRLVGVLSSL